MPVRQARPSDARAIAQVHVASWQSAYRGILPDALLDNLSVERGESTWEARLTEGEGQVLVSERAGRVIGFAAFGPSRDDDADDEVGEIYAIYFDPEEWGKGYGSALAEAAMASLRDQGFSEVTLWMLAENERARAFYKAMGFRADGAEKVETRRDGTELHEGRYRRPLGGALKVGKTPQMPGASGEFLAYTVDVQWTDLSDGDVQGRTRGGSAVKVLVAYATRTGSTAGVAAEIGWVLGSTNGNVVDVRPIDNLKDLGAYGGAVVGSAIRGSKWLPEAVDFVSERRESLRQMPVAYFAVCLAMREDTEENRAEAAAVLDPVREIATPVDVGLFAGAMDYRQFSLPVRIMMRAIKAPEGDFRDWTAIREWAAGLGRVLLGPKELGTTVGSGWARA